MPISREYPRSLFADLMQNVMVPLDPDELLHMPGLAQHGHVFFGDIAVRCYKHKAPWMYDERDIRRTGQAFVELRLDLDDVVDVQLPAYRDFRETTRRSDSASTGCVDWLRSAGLVDFGAARHKAQDGIPYEEWNDSWRQVGVNGLPGDLTWEEFIAASSRYRHSQNMAGTRPLELLTWSGQKWLLPQCALRPGRDRRWVCGLGDDDVVARIQAVGPPHHRYSGRPASQPGMPTSGGAWMPRTSL